MSILPLPTLPGLSSPAFSSSSCASNISMSADTPRIKPSRTRRSASLPYSPVSNTPLAFPIPCSTRSIVSMRPTITDPPWPSPVLICHINGSGSSRRLIESFLNLRPSPDSIPSGITRGITNFAPGVSCPVATSPIRERASFARAVSAALSIISSELTTTSVLKELRPFPFLPYS